MIILFYRQRTRGTERSRYLPKVTQLHFLTLSPHAFLTEMDSGSSGERAKPHRSISMSSLNLASPSPPPENPGVSVGLRAGLVV